MNGQTLSVSLNAYEKMYNQLKEKYDAPAAENQELKKGTTNPNYSDTSSKSEAGAAFIGEQISAYYHNSLYYKEYSSLDTESFSMGKQSYTRGFTIGASEDYGTAIFNLDGKYATFSGLAGNLDGVNQGVTYGVYGDDTLLATIEIEGAALPKEFSIDVTGVRQLKAVCGNKDNFVSGFRVGFANAVLK